VSFLDAILPTRSLPLLQAAEHLTAATGPGTVADPSTYPIATPWGSADLARILYEDVFGTDAPANTRSAAMRLPGVARARNLVVSTIAPLPFAALRRETVIDSPPWFTACHDGSSWQQRLAWTVDDLMFYGWSLWECVRGADTFPLSFARINRDRWELDADNRLTLDGVIVKDTRNMILIPGLHEGVLTYGVDAIRDATALYRIVRERLNNPVPQVDLHQTGGRQLNRDEIDDLRSDWAAARSGQNGGVAYTNEWIEAKPFGSGGENLLIEARNAAVLDLARMIGVHGGMVDATTPKASLNYETAQGRNGEFVDFDLALYMTPITARLSLDDVTARGQRVAFDTASITAPAQPSTGPVAED
jgi:hypothetical protein